MIRWGLIVLGVAVGMLIATMLPFWPAMLSGTDYFSIYSLWRVHTFSEFDWDDWIFVTISTLVTSLLALGGGLAGKTVAERIEDREIENRATEGRCFQCGYPLQGNTSGVCAQCGTSVEGNA